MNILAGKYKGHKIRTIRHAAYRPTQTRIRKSLFDILGDIEQYSVLDLFSGSGILGFEAASRGAASITFVENNWTAVKLLQENKRKFKSSVFNIFRRDAFRFLESCDEFDLIMADPPYEQYSLSPLVEICVSKLKHNGTFVLETHASDTTISGLREKKYGNTKLIFWGLS